MATLPRIYADFQNLDDQNRLRLTTQGTREDLTRYGIRLQEGLKLGFYTDDADDLLADGTVQFNEQEQCWLAAIDWGGLRHASAENSTGLSRS